MLAIRYDSYGPPDVLHVSELPEPSVGPRDVGVRVTGASVGGGEPPIRAGQLRRVLRQRLPAGTGVDFAGTVIEVGSQTSTFKVGDVVWGLVPHGTFGAIAQCVVVPEHRVTLAPGSVPAIEAAALPAVGTTALRALTQSTHLEPGQRLLVRGASGGVGTAAVQIGAWRGAHVTALVSGRDLDWVQQLGASAAYDYGRTGPDQLGTFDAILDLVGSDLFAYRAKLTRGGTLIALALNPDRPVRSMASVVLGSLDRRTRITTFSNDPTPELLSRLAYLVDEGAVRPVIEQTLPLTSTADAHHRLEQGGVRGKIVIEP